MFTRIQATANVLEPFPRAAGMAQVKNLMQKKCLDVMISDQFFG